MSVAVDLNKHRALEQSGVHESGFVDRAVKAADRVTGGNRPFAIMPRGRWKALLGGESPTGASIRVGGNNSQSNSGTASPDAVLGEGPGTELHKLIGRDVKEGCGCREWINWMNEIGPEGCRQNKEKIVSALMDSAQALGKWYERAAVKLARKTTRNHIEALVDRAIAQSELRNDHETD